MPSTSSNPPSRSTQSSLPSPSKHSPPASRPGSFKTDPHPDFDNIESLADIKKCDEKWEEFKSWLRDQTEPGEDGSPLSLERYAVFSELYDQFESAKNKSDERKAVFLQIMNHPLKFFGNYECLQCVDSGMRKVLLEQKKKVKEGSDVPSSEVFAKVIEGVEDRLSGLLKGEGGYQNYVINKQKILKQATSSRGKVL